jgi:hypothetical protein
MYRKFGVIDFFTIFKSIDFVALNNFFLLRRTEKHFPSVNKKNSPKELRP